MKTRLTFFLALAALLLYLTPATLLSDLPRSLSLAGQLVPWRWDWPYLLWTGLHAVALLIIFAGLGGRMLWLARIRGLSAWESLIPGTALGLGASGFFVLGLGLTGLMFPRLLQILYAVLAVHAFLFFFIKGHPMTDEALEMLAKRKAFRKKGLGHPDRLRGWEKTILALLAVWAVLFLCADLLAPEGFWDALVYHLASPKRWMEAHKMTTILPFFSNFPVLMPMNYAIAIAIRGEGLARALDILLGVLLALAVWSTARRWLDRASAVRAALIAGTSPLLLLLSVHAGADTGSALMAVLAVSMFCIAVPGWPSGRIRNSALFLSGAFAGLAYCAKPHGLVVIVVLAIMLAPTWRRLPVFLLPAGALCLPWMARAFLQTGDPLFPLLGMFQGSPFWTRFSREAYGGELLGIWRQFSWSDLNNWGFHSGLVSRYKLGLAGPAALVAVVVALSSRPRRGAPLVIAVFCGMLAFAWAFTVPAWRFYSAGFALVPLLIFLAPGISRPLSWAVLALQALWWPIVVAEVDQPWASARGIEEPETYYSSMHANPSMDAFSYIGKMFKPGPRHRTLATGEVRGYLAPPWTITASYFEEAPFLKMAVEAVNSRRLAIRLRQLGVRYLLINVPEMLRLSMEHRLCWDRPFPQDLLVDFFRKKTSIVYARRAAWVYELSRYPSGAVMPECFSVSRDQRTMASVTSSGMASAALAGGDRKKALNYAYAAVAAEPHSGMAWSMLGDAQYANGRYAEATSSYKRALEAGWRTSAVYRNQAMCFILSGQPLNGQPAMAYAIQLDPYAAQLRQEFELVHEEALRPFRKILGEH